MRKFLFLRKGDGLNEPRSSSDSPARIRTSAEELWHVDRPSRTPAHGADKHKSGHVLCGL